jgi:hypothetical protein
VVTESQGTAKLSRARFNKAMGKVADEAFATKDRRVKGAYQGAKRRTCDAWRKSSEFNVALYDAVTFKAMEPLAKFLESKTLLTRSDRLALARFVRSLKAPKVGRPPGRLPGEENAALRNAAYWVQVQQQAWLNKNNRQRVPASVTNEFITDAINVVSTAFKPRSKLSSDDIRALVNKTSRKIIS